MATDMTSTQQNPIETNLTLEPTAAYTVPESAQRPRPARVMFFLPIGVEYIGLCK